MAWTVISDATLEVGKALRALTMRNLRDNFAALANGDAGAPTIQAPAMATTTAMRDWVVGRSSLQGLGAVGTTAYLGYPPTTIALTAGTSYAGSSLRYYGNNTATTPSVGATPPGTWMALGTASGGSGINSTLFVRTA